MAAIIIVLLLLYVIFWLGKTEDGSTAIDKYLKK